MAFLVPFRALLIALALTFATSMEGAVIRYLPIDLADTNPSEDLWQYRYLASNFAYQQNDGFTIIFDIALYRALQDPPPAVSPQWDVIVLQPDPGLPDDGVYDALALVDDASLAEFFVVDFVYLGTGTPGSQPFRINHFDTQGNLVQELDRGFTTPFVIPEPSSWVLFFSGMALLTRAARLRRR